MLKRKIYEKLITWKQTKPKFALVIKGARQVGKTYIIREFGKKNYKKFIEINFEEEPILKDVFAGNLDARSILLKLSAMGIDDFIENDTLFFFDEIQSCPNARTALKFLVEDGKYDYIASGSLLGINYKKVSSYPVGYEEILEMFPLDFEEYLWAKNISTDVIDILHKSYYKLISVDDFIHKTILKHFYEYMIVGGMPKVVSTFLSSNDFNDTVRIQNILLDGYRNDISTYADKDRVLVRATFDAIPEQLNKKNKRFIFAHMEEKGTFEKYNTPTRWLVEAGIAYNCFNLNSLDIPLSFSEKRDLYKIYMHDTGLLTALSARGLQGNILNGDISINEGMFAENIVASSLVKNGIPLYYFDKKSRNELDFIISERNGITILEVKSGKSYKTHASLDKAELFSSGKINRKIVLSKSNVEISKEGVIYIPIYMVMFIKNEKL